MAWASFEELVIPKSVDAPIGRELLGYIIRNAVSSFLGQKFQIFLVR